VGNDTRRGARCGSHLLLPVHLLHLGSLHRLVGCGFVNVVLPLQLDAALESTTQNQLFGKESV
jgi:hypothetical protein